MIAIYFCSGKYILHRYLSVQNILFLEPVILHCDRNAIEISIFFDIRISYCDNPKERGGGGQERGGQEGGQD